MIFRLGFGLLMALTMAACAAPYVQFPGLSLHEPAVVTKESQLVVKVSDGTRLPLRVWPAVTSDGRPSEPHAIIVGLHGFNDYSNTFDLSGQFWARQGLTTYAYDQRGFGEATEPGTWPGNTLLVRDLEDVTAAVQAEHPGVPIYLHGNSMGGAVVLLALARADEDSPLAEVRGASLTAPAVWGGQSMNPFYRLSLWVASHIFPAGHLSGRGLGVIPSDNIEMLVALGRDPLVIKQTRIDAIQGLVSLMGAAQEAAGRVHHPLLVLYGVNDQIIPRRSMAEMVSRLSAPHRLVVYRNGYHMLLRDLQAEIVWHDVASWVHDPDGPLPSGEERTEFHLAPPRPVTVEANVSTPGQPAPNLMTPAGLD